MSSPPFLRLGRRVSFRGARDACNSYNVRDPEKDAPSGTDRRPSRKRWHGANPVAESISRREHTEEIRYLQRDEVDALVSAAIDAPYQSVGRAWRGRR